MRDSDRLRDRAARLLALALKAREENKFLLSDEITKLAIRRSDLDAEPIRGIVERLHRTGKLILQGGCAEDQLALFTENQGDDNARHHG